MAIRFSTVWHRKLMLMVVPFAKSLMFRMKSVKCLLILLDEEIVSADCSLNMAIQMLSVIIRWRYHLGRALVSLLLASFLLITIFQRLTRFMLGLEIILSTHFFHANCFLFIITFFISFALDDWFPISSFFETSHLLYYDGFFVCM